MVKKIVALVGAIVCAGAAYQAIGSRIDARRFPQRGRSVSIGAIRLNLDCSGAGSTTVVLLSGMSVPAIQWAPVQSEVSRFTRVCSYDRAGYGWSDSGPEPRTSERIASELHQLLAAAGERGPFLLVGHSFGGYNVRVFAARFPEDCAGMVLVDASHGDEQQRLYDVLPADIRARERRDDERQAWRERWLDPLLIYSGVERMRTNLSPELFYLESQRKAFRAVEAEDRAEAESWKQVLAAGGIGDRPLIVLTAGEPYEYDPHLTAALAAAHRDLWIHDLQASTVRLSTRGKQIVVPGSGHMIPVDRPGAVIDAIREVRDTILANRGTF